MTFEFDSDDKVYKVGKTTYVIIPSLYRIAYFSAGFWLGSILYTECMLNPNANTFVIIYLALISLACFQACGLPVDKFINLDLIKSA